MNRARIRLAILFVICGIVSALAASLFLCMTFALLTGGPSALLDGLWLGMRVIHFGLVLATLPAILFGGLLWLRGIRHVIAWAAMGVLAGLVCLGLAYIGPGDIDMITARVLMHQPLKFTLAFAIAGALAALTFLALMRLCTAFTRRRARPA